MITPATFPPTPLFCLGGADLEMATVCDLITEILGPQAISDRGVTWATPCASTYLPDIRQALATGRRVILLELRDDLPADLPRDNLLFVDHHGPAAGRDKPTTLEQVFALLDLPPQRWTRRLALVAANDRGHIRALRTLGASADEIAAIRADDRRSQGITPDEETAGQAALAVRETCLGGRLTLVRLPHGRTATVADPFAIEQPGKPLLVLSPGEVDLFGPGALVTALDRAFPGGWSGGELPEQGFWGHGEPVPPLDAILKAIDGVPA
jgi:hypothetical protein